MQYSDARGVIRSGDILAWSHRAWGSFYDVQIQAVRFFTQSEYCHVGIAWVIGGRVFVIEAVTPKVRIFPLSKLLPFWHTPMNAEWRPATEEYALAQVGADYSKWQAVQAYFGKPDLDHLWECAELTAEVLRRDGIDLGEKYTPSAVMYRAQQRAGSGTVLVE
jgi:hypothetical protein